MKLTIDTDDRTLFTETEGHAGTCGLYTAQAFELLSKVWLAVGWQQKYSYQFTWLGRPIIQLPEDVLRIQEIIYRVTPDIIVETGVAHGGSLVFYASLCKLLGKGRVIGIDIVVKQANLDAIQKHALAEKITIFEGSSIDPATVGRVERAIAPGESVLVILDSCHTKEHVLAELETYARFVTPGSYIVATDGITRDLFDAPDGRPAWVDDNPASAAVAFAARHPEFVLEDPERSFNESGLRQPVTYWPQAWLRRI
jgi:cephalosporin hydroxylase